MANETETTKEHCATIYECWKKWNRTLAHCSECLENKCYAKLQLYEQKIMEQTAVTAQDFAIQVLVDTVHGGFSPSDKLITSAKKLVKNTG